MRTHAGRPSEAEATSSRDRDDLWDDPAFARLRERFHNLRGDVAASSLRVDELARKVEPLSELAPRLRELIREADIAAGRKVEGQERGDVFGSWWARMIALGLLVLQTATLVFAARGR